MEMATMSDVKELMKELRDSIREAVAEAFGNSKPALEHATTSNASQLLTMEASDAKVSAPACSSPDQGTSAFDPSPTATIDILSELDVDTTGVAAPTLITCSMDGLDQNADGDGHTTAWHAAWSVPTSFTKPLEVSPTESCQLSADLDTDSLAPTECSMKCFVKTPCALIPVFMLEVTQSVKQQGQVLRPLPWPSFLVDHVVGHEIRPKSWPSFVNLPGSVHLTKPRPLLQGTSGQFFTVDMLHCFAYGLSWVSPRPMCSQCQQQPCCPDPWSRPIAVVLILRKLFEHSSGTAVADCWTTNILVLVVAAMNENNRVVVTLGIVDQEEQVIYLCAHLNVLKDFLKKPCAEWKEAIWTGLISRAARTFKLWCIPWSKLLFLEMNSEEEMQWLSEDNHLAVQHFNDLPLCVHRFSSALFKWKIHWQLEGSKNCTTDNLTIDGKEVLIKWPLPNIYYGNPLALQSYNGTMDSELMYYYQASKIRPVPMLELQGSTHKLTSDGPVNPFAQWLQSLVQQMLLSDACSTWQLFISAPSMSIILADWYLHNHSILSVVLLLYSIKCQLLADKWRSQFLGVRPLPAVFLLVVLPEHHLMEIIQFGQFEGGSRKLISINACWSAISIHVKEMQGAYVSAQLQWGNISSVLSCELIHVGKLCLNWTFAHSAIGRPALLIPVQFVSLKYIELWWFTTALFTETGSMFSSGFSMQLDVACSIQAILLLTHAYELSVLAPTMFSFAWGKMDCILHYRYAFQATSSQLLILIVILGGRQGTFQGGRHKSVFDRHKGAPIGMGPWRHSGSLGTS